MPHTCHARRCTKVVQPKMLMCLAHWRLVPKDLQRRVWHTYRTGQEIRKDPTPAYLAAADAAIDTVDQIEQSRAGLRML